MRTFGWSKVELTDGRVIMGPAREDRLGGVPFLFIEAIDTDGLLYPSYFQLGQVVSIKPISEKDARDAFRVSNVTIGQIKTLVAYEFGFTVDKLESDDRSELLVRPRWIAFTIARKFGFRLVHIGKSFNRDHKTVSHGIAAAEDLCAQNRDFAFRMAECFKKFGLSLASSN